MVRELKFHREIYDGASLDAAIKQFEPYGQISRTESDSHFIVSLEHADAAAAEQIAQELSNMALGLTVDCGNRV